jgi:hypothetical protein
MIVTLFLKHLAPKNKKVNKAQRKTLSAGIIKPAHIQTAGKIMTLLIENHLPTPLSQNKYPQ